jgi:hypothetical protein
VHIATDGWRYFLVNGSRRVVRLGFTGGSDGDDDDDQSAIGVPAAIDHFTHPEYSSPGTICGVGAQGPALALGPGRAVPLSVTVHAPGRYRIGVEYSDENGYHRAVYEGVEPPALNVDLRRSEDEREWTNDGFVGRPVEGSRTPDAAATVGIDSSLRGYLSPGQRAYFRFRRTGPAVVVVNVYTEGSDRDDDRAPVLASVRRPYWVRRSDEGSVGDGPVGWRSRGFYISLHDAPQSGEVLELRNRDGQGRRYFATLRVHLARPAPQPAAAPSAVAAPPRSGRRRASHPMPRARIEPGLAAVPARAAT